MYYHMIPSGAPEVGVEVCKDCEKTVVSEAWVKPTSLMLAFNVPRPYIIHVLRPYTEFGRITTLHRSIQESKP